MVFAASAAAQGDWWKRARENAVEFARIDGPMEGVGVVQYDNGSVDELRSATPPYEFIGNLFDTRNGQPLSPGSVSFLSWYQGRVEYSGNGGKGGPAVFVAGWAPGPGYPFLTGTAYAQPYAFYAASFSPLAAPNPFVVGVFVEPVSPEGGPPWRGSIGMSSGTLNGQGFHGVQRTFYGSGSTPITNQNAILRVGGSVVVPVELLEFDIE